MLVYFNAIDVYLDDVEGVIFVRSWLDRTIKAEAGVALSKWAVVIGTSQVGAAEMEPLL